MRLYGNYQLKVPVIFLACSALFLLNNCKNKPSENPLFETVSFTVSGIDFVNQVTNSQEFNIFNYRNFYNGGGVAIGDVNKDGLPDIYVTSNQEKNRFYLNKGNFQFEDITDKAGVGGKQAWSTGVTFADVNGDGFLDIYVCNAGNVKGSKRDNELFINNGNLTFTEKAVEYGLNDQGFSTHAAFFDYDRDGDLDVYLLNNSFTPIGRLGYRNLRQYRDNLGGDKLFRNDSPLPTLPNREGVIDSLPIGEGREGAWFTDVSEEAGIYGSLIGFGLGITIGDVNNDNWPDIYISNDFYERDYLYVNQKNGTFKETLKDSFGHISHSSMGADIADINNDGKLDIFVTDMLPEEDRRLKTTSTFEGHDLTQFKLSQDYHHQYMRNMLHLNNGDTTFSEIGQLAGVHATDWSWGALIFDMDNDGQKDIFVANGINKDLTDQDFVAFLGEEETMQRAVEGGGAAYNQELMDRMPSKPIPNYAFRNDGNLQFSNQAQPWGLGEAGFSNGAAYGDLDNDGDLDLIVNNVNSPLSVYRNQSVEQHKTHFLRVRLTGTEKNRQGIGTKVYVHQGNQTQYVQQMPNRGFQSSMDHVLVFGLGNNPKIDSLTVIWPDDRMQILRKVTANKEIRIAHQNATQTWMPAADTLGKSFSDATAQVNLKYRHEESLYVDYNQDALLKQMYSTQGPALATGDVNGDGLDDVFFGSASGKTSRLFVQQKNGKFTDATPPVFAEDSLSEDVDAVFFDADSDGDLDLFVVTGSNEFEPGHEALQDRLYINETSPTPTHSPLDARFSQGEGVKSVSPLSEGEDPGVRFTKDTRLPNLTESGSCVAAADFDRDGDIDLFIGNRLIPSQYGYDPPSFLYVNDGNGSFKNYTKRYLSKNELGMITDVLWQDVDGDQYPELIVVGDWMPITIYKNDKGRKLIRTPQSEIRHSSGWWNAIHAADVDHDGDVDFIAGNLGRNSQLVASADKPAALYVSDFDENGSIEQVITCYKNDGKSYPMVLKPDLQKRLPMVKKKFVKHHDYAGKEIAEVFSPEQLKEATKKEVQYPNTALLLNDGKGNFTLQALPLEAQFSPVSGIETLDYDQDGRLDILLAGNFFDILPELGRYDANYGLVLRGTGKGKFEVIMPAQSGFFTRGQVRHLRKVKGANGQEYIILAKNNDHAQVFSYEKKPSLLSKGKDEE